MRYFPSPLSKEASDDLARTCQALIGERGWGLWAVELPEVAPFIGFVGLHVPSAELPCSPCVEIGWRLAKAYWGQGYAPEAARAALDYAFTQLDLATVVSFTAVSNKPSEAVMQKIGMRNTQRNFMHPLVAPSDPLCEHLLYQIDRDDWLANSETNFALQYIRT